MSVPPTAPHSWPLWMLIFSWITYVVFACILPIFQVKPKSHPACKYCFSGYFPESSDWPRVCWTFPDTVASSLYFYNLNKVAAALALTFYPTLSVELVFPSLSLVGGRVHVLFTFWLTWESFSRTWAFSSCSVNCWVSPHGKRVQHFAFFALIPDPSSTILL